MKQPWARSCPGCVREPCRSTRRLAHSSIPTKPRGMTTRSSLYVFIFFRSSGSHRDLHKRSHTFPTRRSSDLRPGQVHRRAVRQRQRLLQQRGELRAGEGRSEEHTSELQSRTLSSYAVFCVKKKKNKKQNITFNIILKKK